MIARAGHPPGTVTRQACPGRGLPRPQLGHWSETALSGLGLVVVDLVWDRRVGCRSRLGSRAATGVGGRPHWSSGSPSSSRSSGTAVVRARSDRTAAGGADAKHHPSRGTGRTWAPQGRAGHYLCRRQADELHPLRPGCDPIRSAVPVIHDHAKNRGQTPAPDAPDGAGLMINFWWIRSCVCGGCGCVGYGWCGPGFVREGRFGGKPRAFGGFPADARNHAVK
jgi:hypothetical protein